MSHPQMFADDDPVLAQLRALALALPGANEKVSHGRPAFYTTKIFAKYGGHVKGSHSDQTLARALLFLPDADHRDLLVRDERFHVPGYEGAYGWLALRLDVGEVDWAEVEDLLVESFRLTAPPKLVRQLQ